MIIRRKRYVVINGGCVYIQYILTALLKVEFEHMCEQIETKLCDKKLSDTTPFA